MDSLLHITLQTHVTLVIILWRVFYKYLKKKEIHSVCIKQNYNYIIIVRSLLFGGERHAIKLAEKKITIDYEDRLHGLSCVMLLYSRLKFQNSITLL